MTSADRMLLAMALGGLLAFTIGVGPDRLGIIGREPVELRDVRE